MSGARSFLVNHVLPLFGLVSVIVVLLSSMVLAFELLKVIVPVVLPPLQAAFQMFGAVITWMFAPPWWHALASLCVGLIALLIASWFYSRFGEEVKS